MKERKGNERKVGGIMFHSVFSKRIGKKRRERK